MPTIDAPAGLRGVIAAETTIGDVRGDEGRFHYGPYDATELARHHRFEDVVGLFRDGELPTPAQSAALTAELAAARRLPPELHPALGEVARAGGPPLDQLRSALSLAAAARGCRPLLDLDHADQRADALALVASTPMLAAALYRLSEGLAVVEADPDLGTAGAFLHAVTGRRPPEAHTRALETYLIATIDHGFNASTFTARVVASTGADLGACVVAALGALSGPLHGGAPSRALELLDEVADPEAAAAIIAAKLERGERLMGFGHAVYRADDPRSALLKGVAQELGGPRLALAEHVEAAVLDALGRAHPERPLPTNVEFYAGIVLEAVGLPASMFTPAFASARVVGWCAHALEQAAQRRLIRPAARYVGPEPFRGPPGATSRGDRPAA